MTSGIPGGTSSSKARWIALEVGMLVLGVLIGYYIGLQVNPKKYAINVSPTVSSTPNAVSLPIVVFIPTGLFTEEERQELRVRLIDPFIDFSKERIVNGKPIHTEVSPYVVVRVNEYNTGDYRYAFEAYHENGSNLGFVHGRTRDSEIPFWIPGCMGPDSAQPCQFSEYFRNKHPEVVAAYEKNPQ